MKLFKLITYMEKYSEERYKYFKLNEISSKIALVCLLQYIE